MSVTIWSRLYMSTMQAQSLPLEAARLLQLDVTRSCLNSIEQDEAKQLCKVCPARLFAAPVHEAQLAPDVQSLTPMSRLACWLPVSCKHLA